MHVALTAIGRMRRGPERELVDAYLQRAAAVGRGVGLRSVRENELNAPDDRASGSTALMAALKPGACVLLLDERGENLSSRTFAQRLGRWRDQGAAHAAVLIGGADGVSDSLRARADLVWAFGAATWPHKLVRVMAAEQIYRAASLLADAPYHRD